MEFQSLEKNKRDEDFRRDKDEMVEVVFRQFGLKHLKLGKVVKHTRWEMFWAKMRVGFWLVWSYIKWRWSRGR